MSFSGQYISDFKVENQFGVRRFSSGISYFVVYSVVSVGYGLIVLLRKFRGTRVPIYKNQLKYVFAGVVCGFFIALFFSLILPILGYNQFFFIGETSSLFFVGFVVYAIVKHKLLNIEIVFRKSIIYSLLLSSIMGIYALLAITIGQYLKNYTGHSVFITNLITALLMVIGFKPLERFIENGTDKFFFQGRYNYQQTLKDLAGKINMMVDIDMLFLFIVRAIMDSLKAGKISLYIKDYDNWKLASYSYNDVAWSHLFHRTKIDGALIDHFVREREILSSDEIDYRAGLPDLQAAEKDRILQVKKALKMSGISLCVPVINKSGLAGIIALGKKMSDDIYSMQDIEFLSVIAGQLAIVLENAKLNSEAKRMKEQLERSEQLAVLGKFASSLAHEIKNPLTSIKAFFHFFNDGEDEMDRQEIAELAFSEMARMESLLDNLLGFGRCQPPDLVPTNIMQVVDETLAITAVECKGRNVNVVKKYGELPEICADKKQLKQVFMNLIFNSLHAMPGSGLLTVEAGHLAEEGVIKITFSDTGVGIEEEHLPRLFEPFFTTKEQGTGLGLNICKNIIAAHNGKITVESKKGTGTKVHISLPLTPH